MATVCFQGCFLLVLSCTFSNVDAARFGAGAEGLEQGSAGGEVVGAQHLPGTPR